ncbi:hypothetical protein BFJ72_g9700 [Fusarium proliferatum]|uniref:Uncharacterized protein n=1 Tax=Gibberella intermedia TaxID=948311 RepID=A0A420SXI4_GIBIN|nr:hypothetical protein BFJ72_g9700 [Fusarium proliferatum]
MTEMDLTFICGQRTSSLLGGPFAASLFRTTYAKHRGRGPMVIPAALPLDIPAIEEETLCLEIRLNGDGCSVLLETRSLGVVHAGLQAKPTKDPKKNPFSLRYRVTRPRLLFLWKGQGDVLKHTVSFAIYPEGVVLAPNHVPMVIGPQLSSFRPDFASHQPAWSWAPIEHIRSILVHEQDGRGFIGMMIHYDNGSQRFIGDFARADDYDDDIRYPISIEPIKHMYVERWPPSGQYTKIQVHFGPRWLRHSMDTELDEYEFVGELHFWYGPWMAPELRVLPSGSWHAE